MARTASQKRYRKKRLKGIPVQDVRAEELEYLKARKAKAGLSWLGLLYQGLGLRREDYFNSREFKDVVP